MELEEREAKEAIMLGLSGREYFAVSGRDGPSR